MLLLAGMLLPVDGAPGWLRAMSQANPLTYVVDAQRALFGGDFGLDTLGPAVLAALLTAVLGLAVGVRAMRRSE